MMKWDFIPRLCCLNFSHSFTPIPMTKTTVTLNHFRILFRTKAWKKPRYGIATCYSFGSVFGILEVLHILCKSSLSKRVHLVGQCWDFQPIFLRLKICQVKHCRMEGFWWGEQLYPECYYRLYTVHFIKGKGEIMPRKIHRVE